MLFSSLCGGYARFPRPSFNPKKKQLMFFSFHADALAPKRLFIHGQNLNGKIESDEGFFQLCSSYGNEGSFHNVGLQGGVRNSFLQGERPQTLTIIVDQPLD